MTSQDLLDVLAQHGVEAFVLLRQYILWTLVGANLFLSSTIITSDFSLFNSLDYVSQFIAAYFPPSLLVLYAEVFHPCLRSKINLIIKPLNFSIMLVTGTIHHSQNI